MILRTFMALLATVIMTVAPASAHQQKAAISKVLFNPRTQNIEVMHRFYMHDAEHAVREIFSKSADIIKSKETQEKFARYVADRFSIATQDGKALPLTEVGFEADGKFFWVYQETAQLKDLQNLVVRHNALRDLWPSQVNTVNFEGKGKIKTLTFEDNTELLKVEFGHHH